MKIFSRLLLSGSLATTLFLSYGLVHADDASMKSGAACSCNMKGDQGSWSGHDMMDHLKVQLGLTKDQETQLKEAFKSSMETNKPLLDQEKIDMDTLQQKVDTKASDSEIKALLDQLKADHQKEQDAREASMKTFQSILSPVQQAKWVLIHQKWDHKGEMMHQHRMNKKSSKHHKASSNSNTTASSDSSAGQ